MQIFSSKEIQLYCMLHVKKTKCILEFLDFGLLAVK